MLVYYVLAFLTSSATLFGVRQQENKEQSFLQAVRILTGLSFVGLVLSLVPVTLPPVLFLLIQLIAWSVFLWGLTIDKRWIAGFILGLGLLSVVPVIPVMSILSWGLLTAVPLSAILLHRNQPVIPIFAPPKIRSLQHLLYFFN